MVWEVKQLGEACDLYQPKTISAKEMIPDGQYPVFGANGKIGRYDKFNHYEPQILITCRGATCGTINVSEPQSWITGNSMVVKPVIENIDFEFLRYLLIGGVDLSVAITGAAQPQITRTSLSPILITYPSNIKEQKRIVEILDKAFGEIDQAKANAEKNLKNARELFESTLNQIFTRRREGWAEVLLSDVAEVSSGGTPTKSTKGFWNGAIPWYSSGELNDLFTKDSKEMITELGLKSSNAKLFPKGSLLIGMYDTAALKMSILDRDGAFNQAIAGVKPNDNVNLNFIRFYIDSIKPELMAQRRGVRQKNLNQSKIKGINLVLPIISEQNKIASQIIKVKQQTDSLESIYQQKITALDELKKSLLQKAFRGELTQPSIGDAA